MVFNRIKATDQDDDSRHRRLKRQELSAAFRALAATRATDAEYAYDDTDYHGSYLHAQKIALRTEAKVVSLIKEIGEVVVNAERPSLDNPRSSLRDDDVFAYFCEKAILTLLIEMAKENAKPSYDEDDSSHSISLRGVIWSAKVKAQILSTITLLLSGVKDKSALYYVLSQNCINQLMMSILPLNQWSDQSIVVILPAFVELMRMLCLQLGAAPDIFPFLSIQQDNGNVTSFPLFSAIIQTVTSPTAESDSFVHATCLNMIVGLMLIPDKSIHKWICRAEMEHQYLCNHVCSRLVEAYRKIASTTTGPCVDPVRSKAIASQLSTLRDLISMLNDIFWCEIQSLSVQLCELLLQRLVYALLRDLMPGLDRRFLPVGVSDRDCIPEREAAAQASTYVLSLLFVHLEYTPLLRMLGVSLFFPQSTMLWKSWENVTASPDYIMTSALASLVENNNTSETIANPYRDEICLTVSGSHGIWRVIPASLVLRNVLHALSNESLVQLCILPKLDKDTGSYDCVIESALVTFLSKEQHELSTILRLAMEFSSSLAADFLSRVATFLLGEGKTASQLDEFFSQSSLFRALERAKFHFYERLIESRMGLTVDEMFVDVVDSVVRECYRLCAGSTKGVDSPTFIPVFAFGAQESFSNTTGPESLVRHLRSVEMNNIETTRFFAKMSLHFRALCGSLDRFRSRISSLSHSSEIPQLEWTEEAGELASIFPCLNQMPPVGTDIDLRGKTIFPFSLHAHYDVLTHHSAIPMSSELILVLEYSIMFVVTPFANRKVNRGTILLCVSLLNVVAAAADGSALHIAIQHDDVSCLVKNGNLLLQFESDGACLVAAQYLNRCRTMARKDLYDKITRLFSGESTSKKFEQNLRDNTTSCNDQQTRSA
jgi:protein CLEC16A